MAKKAMSKPWLAERIVIGQSKPTDTFNITVRMRTPHGKYTHISRIILHSPKSYNDVLAALKSVCRDLAR